MNLLASYRYQMIDHKKALLIFYAAMVVLSLCLGGVTAFLQAGVLLNDDLIRINGPEAPTLLFLFIVGLCTFKENFLMSLQNGISRKTLFTAKVLTIATVAVIAAAADALLYLLTKGLSYLTGFAYVVEPLYKSLYGGQDMESVRSILLQVFLEIVLALAVMAAGYFLTVLFYRLNKVGKVAVSVGVPSLFLFVLPFCDIFFFHGKYLALMNQIIYYITHRPGFLVGCALLCFAVCSVFSYLLMRRVEVKK